MDESLVRTALTRCLRDHHSRGTLPDQTPRMLREQLAQSLDVDISSIETFKTEMKAWIAEFLGQVNNTRVETKERVKREVIDVGKAGTKDTRHHAAREAGKSKKKSRKDRKAPSSSADSSSSSSSSTSDSEDSSGDSAESPTKLRSLAKMLGVPPAFWSKLDKGDAGAIRDRLVEFCDSKNVTRAASVPTKKEALAFKATREAAAELEGIDTSNIVSSKRRRCTELPF